jgi:hypothetical protein
VGGRLRSAYGGLGGGGGSVADHEQDKAREHLAEREREAVQIFAREFVREAELAPERKSERDEDWREGEKLLHETAKTQALITAGLLGASGAAWFIPEPKHVELLSLAVVLGIFSLGITLAHMDFIANFVRVPSDTGRSFVLARIIADATSVLTFVAATGFLSMYISRNIGG